MPGFMENTGETGWRPNAFRLGEMHLQPLDNSGLENSASGPLRTGISAAQSHTFSLPPLPAPRVKTSSKRGNHLTHFHPISTAECVHFQPNGMSFCWSLWSRINPGIKTDFPGSNLPSSIDFFTLTEPVLPNLTWQPAAQWTGSTLASHRGSSPAPSDSQWSERETGRGRKRTPRCIKQRALLTENTEIKLFCLCFTSNYVF